MYIKGINQYLSAIKTSIKLVITIYPIPQMHRCCSCKITHFNNKTHIPHRFMVHFNSNNSRFQQQGYLKVDFNNKVLQLQIFHKLLLGNKAKILINNDNRKYHNNKSKCRCNNSHKTKIILNISSQWKTPIIFYCTEI